MKPRLIEPPHHHHRRRALARRLRRRPRLAHGRKTPPAARDTPGANPDDPNATPAALECTVKPEGRSYVLFDGSKLEDTRANENVGVNRARLKPFAVIQGEYQRVLGLVPASIAGSAGSFDDAPARWFAEACALRSVAQRDLRHLLRGLPRFHEDGARATRQRPRPRRPPRSAAR